MNKAVSPGAAASIADAVNAVCKAPKHPKWTPLTAAALLGGLAGTTTEAVTGKVAKALCRANGTTNEDAAAAALVARCVP